MVSVLATLLVATPASFGQSGTRQPAAAQGKETLALRGYCPVCVVNMKKWVPGKPEYSVRYDGHVYRFPGAEQMEMFKADPAKYTPVLHGDCVVCLANMGQRVPGKLDFAQIHQGRVYLFPSEEQRQMFKADPAKYADADLALGGACAVCRVEMQQEVPGKPEFAVHHNGLRYLFPGEEQRKMFLANPAKYAVKPTEGSGPAAGSQSSTIRPEGDIRTVSVSGRTSCAGCEHGVKPLGDPDVLGLAVVTDAGTLYVVEGAHELYPNLYEGRFDSRVVSLSGDVIREEGKVVWVRPTSLTLVR
jgi:YHS domain-containing protein